MKSVDVNYKRSVYARKLGQKVNQAGIEITDWESSVGRYGTSENSIQIRPINKKDGYPTTNLSMEIPKESISELIEVLKQFI